MMQQLLLKVGLAIALVVVLLAGGALGQCAMWSYDEGTENGPEVWGDLCVEYAKCSQGYATPSSSSSLSFLFPPPPRPWQRRFLLMMPMMYFIRPALLGR